MKLKKLWMEGCMTSVWIMISFLFVPKAQTTKAKISMQDCLRLKSFYTVKGTLNKIKMQWPSWKKYF
jgi:hypothetical protein